MATSNAQTRNYITGNDFRALAEYVVENGAYNFAPETVMAGSIIYVEVYELGYFFNTIFPRIHEPIILISHNGDMPAPGAFAEYLNDPKIIMWFGQNCDIKGHPKFTPIPIGLANAKYKHGNTAIFDALLNEIELNQKNGLKEKKIIKDKKLKRIPKLYVNFLSRKDPLRIYLHKFFNKQPFVTYSPRKSVAEYLAEMIQHKYTLSPFGNGLDCHRTWEALLMGSIPVVQTSTLDPLYKDLPVIIVQKWEEITPAYLQQQYETLRHKLVKREKLFMDYWRDLIQNCAATAKNNSLCN